MATIGQPEMVYFTCQNLDGTFFDPDTVKLVYQASGLVKTEKSWPGADLISHDSLGHFSFVIPAPSSAGRYVYRWTGFDASAVELAAFEGTFLVDPSLIDTFQPTDMPYGRILLAASDFQAIRDQLGVPASEVPNSLLGDDPFVPTAERWVTMQVPDWKLILRLEGPTDPPAVTTPAVAESLLLASDYYVGLVPMSGRTPGRLGAISTAATVVAGEALEFTLPTQPGITSYDAYVGTSPDQLFYQANFLPGSTYQLLTFSLNGVSSDVLPADADALRSATIAVVCSNLCARFQRTSPKTLQTLTYREQFDHDWRAEEARYFVNARRYLGLISTYRPTIPLAVQVGGGHRQHITDFGDHVEIWK